MAKHHLDLLVTILLVILVAYPATALDNLPTLTSNSSTPTAYDMLEQYNLTRGILPEGVTGYVLHPDGSFEVYLPGDCDIYAANMQIQYSSRIAGNIQNQSISALEGVKVKMVFAWVSVTAVNRADDQLHFFAGSISKSFPIEKFANSPQCN